MSFAFTQPNRVRKSTLDAVLAAAHALGYVPSANARGLATGLTGAIGLYSFDHQLESVHGKRDPQSESVAETDFRRFPLYVDEVQRGVQLECRRRGYALMLGAGHNPGNLPDVIDIAGRVDGLIAFAGSAPPEAIVRVTKRIPVVELGGEDAHRAASRGVDSARVSARLGIGPLETEIGSVSRTAPGPVTLYIRADEPSYGGPDDIKLGADSAQGYRRLASFDGRYLSTELPGVYRTSDRPAGALGSRDRA